jgi:hypothetical protein
MNQVLWTRVGIVATAAGALGLAGFVCFGGSSVMLTGRSGDRSVVELRLITELQTLRATWEPRQRERVLERAKGFGREFAGPMSRLLRLDDHELLEQAAEYAGAMGIADVREDLVALATSRSSLAPRARIEAVKSAERLGPWSSDDLGEFLVKGSVPLRLAALEVCAGRSDVPWMEILQILCSQHADDVEGVSDADRKLLREAAVQVVPMKPDTHVLGELWSAVMIGETHIAAAALGALARTEPDAGLASKLLAHLDQLHGSALLAGLDVLATWERRLSDPGPVWTIVERHDLDVETRAHALWCLEKTASFSPDALRDALPTMPPIVQHFAARCLLTTGHVDGFRALLDVTESEDVRAVPMARQLLAWLTGKAPSTDREGFEQDLIQTLASLQGRALPAPGFVVK